MLQGVRRGIAAALSVAALSACGTTSGGDEGAATTSSDVEANLRARPSFEDARQQYRAAVEGWAAQIVSMSTGLTWRVKEDSWVGCSGDYANTPGVHAYIYVVFDGPVPDESWPRALDVVRQGAAQLGATTVTTPVDTPRDHDVVFAGSDGVAVEFGTKAVGVLSATSDCRLRRADLPVDIP
ncbi:LppA family lipoprotein [Mycobacterium sp. ITM-2016-00316]|uniref:LppA family lipoprotein n=1 Tax=Mycobacterium sp. ITM-2016-00316 TaxID=2099695 RepID=UPI001304A0AE|nr:LppA family lipoprotein [Mycobacterium sp. ITM-2016-00316]WNG84298.1 LppA family lipoprotein [Mycobacterium sp. ITM-2016-00316]